MKKIILYLYFIISSGSWASAVDEKEVDISSAAKATYQESQDSDKLATFTDVEDKIDFLEKEIERLEEEIENSTDENSISEHTESLKKLKKTLRALKKEKKVETEKK